MLWEAMMSETLARTGAKNPCETPGCSVNCSYAYSCHEQRMGRSRVAAWPIVALAILVGVGLLL